MPQEPRPRGLLSIESLEHSKPIVLGSVLAKLEFSLDSIDWHLEGDDGFGELLEKVPP
jgi:hypothetical protein